MDTTYIETVRLLLDAAPEVFRSGIFAMKGGTAINLFVQELPRLSVDIDVVYVPHDRPRETALTEIATELNTIRDRLQRRGLAAEVIASCVGDETKIFVRRGRTQVKVEINHVFRGTVLSPERRPLVKTARDLFTVDFNVPTLAVPELYGSKIVAALDRPAPARLLRCAWDVPDSGHVPRDGQLLHRLPRRPQSSRARSALLSRPRDGNGF